MAANPPTKEEVEQFAQQAADRYVARETNRLGRFLEKLIERFRKENTLRDAGVAAGKTLKRIRDLATQEELIKFYEEEMNVRNK